MSVLFTGEELRAFDGARVAVEEATRALNAAILRAVDLGLCVETEHTTFTTTARRDAIPQVEARVYLRL